MLNLIAFGETMKTIRFSLPMRADYPVLKDLESTYQLVDKAHTLLAHYVKKNYPDKTIVYLVTGTSGLIPVTYLNIKYSSRYIYIRKEGESSHSSYINMNMDVDNLIDQSKAFVVWMDDFISTGRTLVHVLDVIKNSHEKPYDEHPNLKTIDGIMLYSGNDARYVIDRAFNDRGMEHPKVLAELYK